MRSDIINLLKERATVIAKHALFVLRENDPNDIPATNAFKFAYLILRQPKQFLEKFGVDNLFIDMDEISGFLWIFSGELPNSDELLPEELEIINAHNQECEFYLDQITSSKVIKLGG